MTGHRAPFWSATLFLAVLLTLLFGTDYALDHPRAATPNREPIKAVYFTDGYAAVLTPERARALGIEPVTTFAALRERAANADAIVIERAMLVWVPSGWLKQQHRQGKLILGLNIPMSELIRVAEYDGNVGDSLSSYGGRSFYSFFYRRSECGIHYAGSGSDAIYSSEIIAGLVRLKTRPVECPPTPTGPPRYRPTPTVTATPSLVLSVGDAR